MRSSTLRLVPILGLLTLGFTSALRAENYSITSVAGSASSAGGVDGTPGTFNSPAGIAIDAAKNLYVTDMAGHTIRKISPGRVVSTLAGSPGISGAVDGTGSAARFNSPTGIAVDASGNVYVAEAGDWTIRKITPAGVVSTFAGAAFQLGSADGVGTAARFFIPYGLAIDSSGNLYVADRGNHTIRKITADGTVSTLAGTAQQSGFVDGTGSAARFNNPWGVTVDTAGNVFVADYGNNAVRKITPAGVVTTVAGASGSSGFLDGSTTVARFNQPGSVSVNSNGDLFVSDSGNSVVRQISGGTVTKVAGLEGVEGSTDSVGASARFYNPTGIVADGTTVYVADSGNNLIRRGVPASTASLPTIVSQPLSQIINAGQSVSFGVVVSGSGLTYQWLKNGFAISGATSPTYSISGATTNDEGAYTVHISGTDGAIDSPQASLTVFATPQGPITSRPISQAITAGQSVTFTATASGSSPTYQWSKNGNNISGATSASYSIASVQPGDAGVYTVTVNAATASSEMASATLVVLPVGSNSVTIVAQPTSRNVSAGQSVTFSVTATGTNLTYQWQKNGSNLTGATSTNYTIPSAQSSDAGTYTVLVTSGGTTQPSAPAVLTVGSSSITITTQPASQTVAPGQSVTFTVAASGSGFTYQWQKNGAAISGASNASYTIASAQPSDAASYTAVVSAGSTSVTSNAATLSVTTGSSNPPAHLINLSILTSLESATDAFTLGYVVGNSGTSTPKPLVIRAVGPGLAAVGVTSGFVADPKLETFAGPTKSGENDNWGGSPALSNAFSSVGAFPLSPTSLDAAVAANITTRDNSVKVSSANGGSGLVIAEVYDATASGNWSATGPRLINVSVLKNLGNGFTIGFVIRGEGNKSVVVRAIGPGLANVGVTSGFVADPKLTLFGAGSAVLATNDNWGGTTTLSNAFTAVGAFQIPTTSSDAAVLASLPSGDYTVQVSNNGNPAGLVLVEVYEVP